MAENAPQHEPKLSDADVIIGSVLMLTLDAIDWLQVGIPGTDLVGFPLEQLFLNKKGVKGTTALVGNIIELVPGVDYLPVRSIAWLITAWMDRHPSEFSEKMEQVGEVVQKAEGKAGAGALQAEGAAAKEAATAAEQGAAQGAAGAVEKGAAEGGASSAAGTAEKSAQDKIAASEQGSGSVRDRMGETSGGEQGEGEEGQSKEEAKPLTLEQQREENAIKGLNIDDLALDVFSPEEMMADIGAPTLGAKVLKFDPDRAIEPKAPRKWPTQSNMNRKGIIDNERVDLKNADKPKPKEFLEDAA
jgi:hypothetical protein